MSSPVEGALAEYSDLVRKYHAALDLVSPTALQHWEDLLGGGVAYAELAAKLSPAPRVVLDLGSGVGLPGVPLAVRMPEAEVWLVERRRRRTAFLNLVVGHLGLDNVTVAGVDVQDLSGPRVDLVTAQAVAPLPDVYALTRHLHADRVWLMSRRGPDWRDEVDALAAATVGSLDAGGSAGIEVEERPLSGHGTLVAVFLAGGLPCP